MWLSSNLSYSAILEKVFWDMEWTSFSTYWTIATVQGHISVNILLQQRACIPLQVTIYHAFLIVRPNAPGRKLQFKVTCSLISHILIQFMHMHWEKWLWPPIAQSATSKLVGKSSAFNICRIYSPRLQGGKEALKKIYISKNQRNNLKWQVS